MYWQNWQDFIHMGGYAFYVWTSFAITFGAMAIELWALILRKRQNQRFKDAQQ